MRSTRKAIPSAVRKQDTQPKTAPDPEKFTLEEAFDYFELPIGVNDAETCALNKERACGASRSCWSGCQSMAMQTWMALRLTGWPRLCEEWQICSAGSPGDRRASVGRDHP